MTDTIKIHFTLSGAGVCDQVTANEEFREEVIQTIISNEMGQDKEVLIWSSEGGLTFPHGVMTPGTIIYKFCMEVPIELVQIDTEYDWFLDDWDNPEEYVHFPKEGLIIPLEDIKGGERIVDLYKTINLVNPVNNKHYVLDGCSLPEFKIEYLKAVEIWYYDKLSWLSLLKDITEDITITDVGKPTDPFEFMNKIENIAQAVQPEANDECKEPDWEDAIFIVVVSESTSEYRQRDVDIIDWPNKDVVNPGDIEDIESTLDEYDLKLGTWKLQIHCNWSKSQATFDVAEEWECEMEITELEKLPDVEPT